MSPFMYTLFHINPGFELHRHNRQWLDNFKMIFRGRTVQIIRTNMQRIAMTLQTV